MRCVGPTARTVSRLLSLVIAQHLQKRDHEESAGKEYVHYACPYGPLPFVIQRSRSVCTTTTLTLITSISIVVKSLCTKMCSTSCLTMSILIPAGHRGSLMYSSSVWRGTYCLRCGLIAEYQTHDPSGWPERGLWPRMPAPTSWPRDVPCSASC